MGSTRMAPLDKSVLLASAFPFLPAAAPASLSKSSPGSKASKFTASVGKEISRFDQGQDDFVENIEDAVIRYDGGRVAANESLKAENQKAWITKNNEGDGSRPENDSCRAQREKRKGLNACEGRSGVAAAAGLTGGKGT
jgi:hypothetical protein